MILDEETSIPELISNAVLDSRKEMVIKIIPDNDPNTLALIDTGIGMTKAELINHFGTIARMNSRRRPKMGAQTIGQWTGNRSGSQVASPICRWAPDRGRDQTSEQYS